MKKSIVRFLTIVSMAVAGAFSVSAESLPSDGSEISLATDYDVSFAQSYHAKITAPSSGNLIQTGSMDVMLEGAGNRVWLGYGDRGPTARWMVEAGKTYEVVASFVMNNDKVRFDMEDSMALELTSSSPAEGSELTISSQVNLHFNNEVTFSTAYIEVADRKETVSIVSSPSNTLTFDISSVMTSLYTTGVLNPAGGDAIAFVVTGVQTPSGIKYGDDGVVRVNYVAAPRQVDIVNAVIPTSFKSYYVPGDPESVLSFTFSDNIKPEGVTLSIACGNVEGAYYVETLDAQVDGAVATVDLSGKLRDLNGYLSSDNDIVGLKLSGIFDLEGRPAVGGSASNYASYSYGLKYQYITPENVICEFSPATGSSLAGVDEIEIWFNKSEIFSYDGVELLYFDGAEEKSVVVGKGDLDITTAGDETTIHVAVPAQVKDKIGVTVRLHNLQSTDGYDHAIMAEYDKFVVSLIAPIQPGQSIASTGTDDFEFDIFGAEKYFYIRYDFYNAEGPEGWVYGTDLVKQEDGTWTAFNGDFPCFNNYEPRMVISAYYTSNDHFMGDKPAETYEFTFRGTQVPFSYSDVKFESIDPAPGTELVYSDDIVFTVKFDGVVTIDPQVSGVIMGMGAGMLPFNKIEPVFGEFDQKGEYANTWRLYPEMAALSDRTSIELSIKAYDEDGKIVEGNMGGNEYDYLAFEYPLFNASSLYEVNVSPSAGIVEKLSDFVVSYDGKAVGVNFSYTGDEQVRIVSNKAKEVIFIDRDAMKVVSDQLGVDEFGNPIYSEITRVEFSVSPAITEEGDYMLLIPADYFIIGDQFDVHGNAAAEIEYSIGGEAPQTGRVLTLSPEPGESLPALSRIDITADGIEESMIDYEGKITVTAADGREVYEATGMEIDANAFDMMTWTFIGYYIEPNIVDPGVYTVSIPEGMFTFADESTSSALTAVYTVSTTSLSTVIVETAAEYNVYTISGVLVLSTADAADLSSLRPGLYIINGKKVLVK